MSNINTSLFLDFRKNVIESKMVSTDKKCILAQSFNWVAFGATLGTLALAIFILFSTTIAMLVSTSLDVEKIKHTYDFISHQFRITEWLLVAFIAIIGSFSVASTVFYFLFLKGCPSTRLIINVMICWIVGIVSLIASLIILLTAYKQLNNSFYRYDNTSSKVLICVGALFMVVASQLILIPDIMLLTGHQKINRYSSVASAYEKIHIVAIVFASIDIGTGGFAWLNVLMMGTNRGGYSVFIQYLWMISYFAQIIFMLAIMSLILIESAFIRKKSSIVMTCVSNTVMYCGFILSFYFICTQYYNNTQLKGTFDLLGVFKLFVPSMYFLITYIFRKDRFESNFK